MDTTTAPCLPATSHDTPVRRAFRTPVRGHAFAPRLPDAGGPTPGQLARLVREPTNPADDLAVGVWVADRSGRWRIGYLDRAVAARIAPRLDAGARIAARVEGWTGEPDGRWLRPLLLVLPDGPSTPESSSPATDTPPPPARADRQASPPGLWGRPPGVARRRITRAAAT